MCNKSTGEPIKALGSILHNSSLRMVSRRIIIKWVKVNLLVPRLRLGWIVKSRMPLMLVNLRSEMSLINLLSFNRVITFSKIWESVCKSLRWCAHNLRILCKLSQLDCVIINRTIPYRYVKNQSKERFRRTVETFQLKVLVKKFKLKMDSSKIKPG